MYITGYFNGLMASEANIFDFDKYIADEDFLISFAKIVLLQESNRMM